MQSSRSSPSRTLPWGDCSSNRVQADALRQRRLSVFHITLHGTPYQVVAQLNYRDDYRQHLRDVVAFTINLEWVRAHYFRDLTNQVWNASGSAQEGLAFSVVDDKGVHVVGSVMREGDTLTNTRPFELMFVDPELMIEPPGVPSEPWKVQVSAAGDVALSQAIRGANRTFLIGAASAFTLAIGLVLTARAERSSAKLAEMRSDLRIDRHARAQDAHCHNPRSGRDVVSEPPERDRHVSVVRAPRR